MRRLCQEKVGHNLGSLGIVLVLLVFALVWALLWYEDKFFFVRCLGEIGSCLTERLIPVMQHANQDPKIKSRTVFVTDNAMSYTVKRFLLIGRMPLQRKSFTSCVAKRILLSLLPKKHLGTYFWATFFTPINGGEFGTYHPSIMKTGGYLRGSVLRGIQYLHSHRRGFAGQWRPQPVHLSREYAMAGLRWG